MKLFLSRKWGCLMLLPLAASLYAQKDLKTRATQVGIDERGYYQSIQVNGEQILGGMQPGQPGGSDWSWTTPCPGRFAVRLKVEGDGAIENPQFTTPEGVIKFPCTVKEHQYQLYTFDGKAVVTDKNYNVVQTVVPEGEALMPAGTSAVSFSCSLISEDAPDVVIRFMTLGEPETVEVR